MDGAQGTIPTKKSVPALRAESDWRISLLVRTQTLRLTFLLGHLGAGAVVMSRVHALTRPRSHAILTSDAAPHLPACLSLCTPTVQTGNPKCSRIRKLSSISVMPQRKIPHPPRVSSNGLYPKCRLTEHIAGNHLQAVCIG